MRIEIERGPVPTGRVLRPEDVRLDRPPAPPRPRPTATDPGEHIERAILELLRAGDAGRHPTSTEIAHVLGRDPRIVGAKLHRLEGLGAVARVSQGYGRRLGWVAR